MKRVFIAVDISAEARAKVANHIQVLKRKFPDLRVGWEKPEKLHLTLKFLGDTNENQLREICLNLKELGEQFAPFQLRVDAPAAFGKKILFLEIKDASGNLPAIQRSIEAVCGQNGFPAEMREYKPHLTIARIRQPHRADKLIAQHQQMKFAPLTFIAAEIVVYESVLQFGGSKYRLVEKFPLVK